MILTTITNLSQLPMPMGACYFGLSLPTFILSSPSLTLDLFLSIPNIFSHVQSHTIHAQLVGGNNQESSRSSEIESSLNSYQSVIEELAAASFFVM